MDTTIDIFRHKLGMRNTRLTKLEFDALQEVYGAITEKTTGRHRILNKGCSSCIMDAFKIVDNGIKLGMFNVPKDEPKEDLTENVQWVNEGLIFETSDEIKYKPSTRKEYISALKKIGVAIPRNAKKETLKQLYHENI